MRKSLFLSVLVAAIGAAPAPGAQDRDPDAAELIFSDLDLFWKAYDAAKPGNRAEVLRAEYLEKGSVGLKGGINTTEKMTDLTAFRKSHSGRNPGDPLQLMEDMRNAKPSGEDAAQGDQPEK